MVMKENEYNAIGIESQLDWPRIKKLLTIGLFAACLTFVGDWLYNYLMKAAPDIAYSCSLKFATYFMLPSFVLFAIFFFYMIAVQISAFAKKKTPYPRWCWIFNPLVGMIFTLLVTLPFSGYAWGNALAAAWISIGNIWQFAGLLAVMKKVSS